MLYLKSKEIKCHLEVSLLKKYLFVDSDCVLSQTKGQNYFRAIKFDYQLQQH